MSKYPKYEELKRNPANLEIKENAKEVIFTLVSCMCDNVNRLTFKKKENGEFSVSLGIECLGNLQMEGDYETDLRWSADDWDWKEVERVIHTGTSRIESVRSR